MQGTPQIALLLPLSSAFAPGREERLRAGVTRTNSSERSDLRPEFAPTRLAGAFGTPYGDASAPPSAVPPLSYPDRGQSK